MYTTLCDTFDIEYPIFAFTHCRDVVVAVARAGGFGVLGAVGFTAEQLAVELKWIDEHIGDYTYGVDIVIPQKYEGKGEEDPKTLLAKLESMIPAEHREFANKLLAEHDIPELEDNRDFPEGGLMGWTEATAKPLLDEALRHDKVKLIANALGTPPVEIIEQIHASGRKVAALCGRVKQALRHKDSGIDIVVCQGGEGGGHTGDVGSLVLWPQVIDAVAPTPVLAAGGVGNGRQIAAALAMGAAGVWTGSLWLTVSEAEAQPAQKQSYLEAVSEDAVRSRSYTGKPCRMLRNDWTEAWASAENPDPLGMPLQGMVTADAMRRTSRYAAHSGAQQLAFNPVGQVIGQISQEESCRDVIFRLVNEYVEAIDRLNALMPEEA